MPARSALPGVKRATRNGVTVWFWAASALSRNAARFRPKTMRLWAGSGPPSSDELRSMEREAQKLTLELRDWLEIRSFRTMKSHRRALSAGAVVYFVRAGDKVKIGFSRNLRRRMIDLQNASPIELELIHTMPGSTFTEHKLHVQFSNQRAGGEWFRYEGPIADFIVENEQRSSASEPTRSQRGVTFGEWR